LLWRSLTVINVITGRKSRVESVSPEPMKVRRSFSRRRAGELQRGGGGNKASVTAEVGLQSYFPEVCGWFQSVVGKC